MTVDFDPHALRTWYLAQLKPNGARLAERNLLRQGYEVFHPKHKVTKQLAERFVTREESLFSGYLFVGLVPGERRWAPINGTLGVNKLVSFGGEAATVPPALIAALKHRCDAQDFLEPTLSLSSGDPVRIVGGPFADFVTRVVSIDAQRRVWVLLDLMGRATRVGLSAAEVSKVEA
jgi:transcriptional antiterminator RfaH